jgi:hypothetical protein
MPRFRKRPVVIEAEQWHPGTAIEGVYAGSSPQVGLIDTLEGTMTVSPGDWVVTGIQGERYPVKPEIFERTYEPADGWEAIEDVQARSNAPRYPAVEGR